MFHILMVSLCVCVCVCAAQTDCADSSRQHRPGQRRPTAPDWRERDRREVPGNAAPRPFIIVIITTTLKENSVNQKHIVTRGIWRECFSVLATDVFSLN